jgi:hypothetical protein
MLSNKFEYNQLYAMIGLFLLLAVILYFTKESFDNCYENNDYDNNCKSKIYKQLYLSGNFRNNCNCSSLKNINGIISAECKIQRNNSSSIKTYKTSDKLLKQTVLDFNMNQNTNTLVLKK